MGELSQNPAPPTKRRRRWFIPLLALILVAPPVWWNWPRGDARLVGTWRARLEDGTYAQVTFYANGVGISEIPPDDRCRFSWRVENEKLISGTPMEGRMQSLCMSLSEYIYDWTGTYLAVGQIGEQSIVEVSPNRIILKSDAAIGSEATTTIERVVN